MIAWMPESMNRLEISDNFLYSVSGDCMIRTFDFEASFLILFSFQNQNEPKRPIPQRSIW